MSVRMVLGRVVFVLSLGMAVAGCRGTGAPAPAAGTPAAAGSAAGSTSAAADRIQLQAASGSPRAMTLDDIVSLREVSEPRRSPDGKQAAFLVRQAFRETNDYRTALFVSSTAAGGGAPTKLIEESALSGLEWTPDGRALTYLSAKSGSQQLWRVDPSTGSAAQVFTHTPAEDQSLLRRGYNPGDTTPVGVMSYRWSPDGKHIAFMTFPPADKAAMTRLSKTGVLYDDAWMNLTNLYDRLWTKAAAEVWVYDVDASRERKAWQAPAEVSDMAWSPDSTRLAVAFAAPPVQKESMIFFNQDLGVITMADGSFKEVSTGEAVERLPVWSRDGRSIAFVSSFGYKNSSLTIVDLTSGARRDIARGNVGASAGALWWDEPARRLIFESDGGNGKRRERTGIYAASIDTGDVRRITSVEESMTDCDDIAGGRAACIRQSSNVPPDPALVSLADGTSQPVAAVNAAWTAITRGHVEERRWTNKLGDETNGFLIRPLDAKPGVRVPLLLIVYGYRGEFVSQAEWESSYPAQAFARDGFAVMLVNYPRYDDWTGRDFARGSVAEGYSPLASLEAIVKTLTDEGLVDPQRVGMMGTSYGGFWTQFTITQSSLVRVSSLANAGDFNPAFYAIAGNRGLRENAERVMGGPPYGETLKNYLKFSPAFNAHRVRGPVLMEFNPKEGLIGLEMHSAFRRANVPVELYLYPDDGHIFVQPEHRFHSMQRNLDWFKFWLKDEEDTADPEKRDQYARWREMKAALAGKGGATTAAAPARTTR